MPQPGIKVLAVYKVKLTPELLEEAMESKYGGMKLSLSQREWAKGHVIEEITSAVLVELLVANPDQHFDLSDFHQTGSDQSPYDEVYLTEDGQSVLSGSSVDVPKAEVFRVAFFLHYFEPDKPLITSYGEVEFPPVQEMPEYLHVLIPYHPVD
jgi:hypothetical protein